MTFKIKLTALVGALVLASSAYSARINICPDINDIKSEGLSMAEIVGPDLYVSYNISKYNTDTIWGFIIAPVEAGSIDEAIDNANDILSEMNGQGTPEEHGTDTLCDYDTGHPDILAAAVSSGTSITPLQLKYLFKKYR